MHFDKNSITQWVDYIQTLHAREIELTLDRVRAVYEKMHPDGLSCKIISIAGTNGKGSTAEILSSIYTQAGYRVGKFTSPHLVHFNERFCINGEPASDSQMLKAFDAIEQARGDIPITFFEYGVLLAASIFSSARIDVAVMEVGLGGRLDAVNILDADVSVVTSIALDHTAWLGDTLEKIAYEKSGIARSNAPCIVGVTKPQQSMRDHLAKIGAIDLVVDRDFYYLASNEGTWSYSNAISGYEINSLPLPFNQAGVQLSNVSLAITAALQLEGSLPVSKAAIHDGISNAKIMGRCEVVSDKPFIVFDVSHNEASVKRLATFLHTKLANNSAINGKVVALCGMLQDKEIAASFSVIDAVIEEWHLVTIDNERGATAAQLAQILQLSQSQTSSKPVKLHEAAIDAYQEVKKSLNNNDCLVVFGSFFLLGDIIRKVKNDTCAL